MAAPNPLTGIELIDCAKANAPQGLAEATRLCGYGTDTDTFQTELKSACESRGIELEGLEDLITDGQIAQRTPGIEISPDTQSEL